MKRARKNIYSLRGAALPMPQRNEEVIENLEALLHEAKSGNVAGLACATISPFGHIATVWAGNADSHRMIAGVVLLQQRILRANE